MTLQEKMNWIQKAGNMELLNQWFNFRAGNAYGVNNDDIQLVEKEILKRMESASKYPV